MWFNAKGWLKITAVTEFAKSNGYVSSEYISSRPYSIATSLINSESRYGYLVQYKCCTRRVSKFNLHIDFYNIAHKVWTGQVFYSMYVAGYNACVSLRWLPLRLQIMTRLLRRSVERSVAKVLTYNPCLIWEREIEFGGLIYVIKQYDSPGNALVAVWLV